MNNNIFLAALPSHDNRLAMTQKIHACEAKRSPLVRVQWTHINDLHLTIGFIPNVTDGESRMIAVGMSVISQNAPFMATVADVRLYGNAIVLRVEPYHHFLSIHKKMNQKLMEITNNQHQFLTKSRFDPHLTIGRIKNLRALNPLHKQQLLSLIGEQLRGSSFLIQHAALLKRSAEEAVPAYQTIQLYLLQGKK